MRALILLSRFMGNTFALWVLLFAILAFFRPPCFLPLTAAIAPLLGLVMFGMGLTLKGEDFAEVARHPWRVAPRRAGPLRHHARHGLVALPPVAPAGGDRGGRDPGRLLPRRHRFQRDDLAVPWRCGPVGGHHRGDHPARPAAHAGADLAAGLGLAAGVVRGNVPVDPPGGAGAHRPRPAGTAPARRARPAGGGGAAAGLGIQHRGDHRRGGGGQPGADRRVRPADHGRGDAAQRLRLPARLPHRQGLRAAAGAAQGPGPRSRHAELGARRGAGQRPLLAPGSGAQRAVQRLAQHLRFATLSTWFRRMSDEPPVQKEAPQ